MTKCEVTQFSRTFTYFYQKYQISYYPEKQYQQLLTNTISNLPTPWLTRCVNTREGWGQGPNILIIITHKKIPHTSNTRPSCTCVIQEYRLYTMSLSQFHRCCQYHKSMSIPWDHVYTMRSCLYHDSMFLPWVHVYTRNLNYRYAIFFLL